MNGTKGKNTSPDLKNIIIEIDSQINPALDVNFFSKSYSNKLLTIKFPAEYYTIFFVQKGSGILVSNFKEYNITDNSFFLINKNESAFFKFSDLDRIIYQMLCFDDDVLLCPEAHIKLKDLPILRFTDKKVIFNLDKNENESVLSNFKKINEETKNKQRWQWNMMRILLAELLIFLSRKYVAVIKNPISENDAVSDKFFLLLEEKYAGHLSINDYSILLNVSPITLAKRIKLATGKTFQSAVNERIIIEAMRKLFNTDKSAKEIAYELGFDDPAYFHRLFKKTTGYTPSEFRIYSLKKYS